MRLRSKATQFERRALGQPFNLADGHARHRLKFRTRLRVTASASIALLTRNYNVLTSEKRFMTTLSILSGVDYLAHYSRIVYSASIAIDICAKFLRRREPPWRVGLIHPTFDNIADLLRAAGLELIAIDEALLFPEPDLGRISDMQLDALFIVLPNNPTGQTWARRVLEEVISWAASTETLLLIDFAFRYFEPDLSWDQVACAEQVGASLMTIDDTGKIVSPCDAKVGVITCTADVAESVDDVVSDVLLNVSVMELLILDSAFSAGGHMQPEVQRARKLVRRNRRILRRVLEGAISQGLLSPLTANSSGTSVEWFGTLFSDADLVEAAKEHGVSILPGYPFFWYDRTGASSNFFRVALLREPYEVEAGSRALQRAIMDLARKSPERTSLGVIGKGEVV